ncbi:iron-sulfur cluster repair di-iron protein [Flavobacterium oreochromis]|uniref:Iron-sulfur cluster repair di-iron protein n=1 Tax=Flavobacterium oreochromis TaxID=2906078 RepID=A0ABW8PAS3_9FLAO|nr:iron-sulfur cluster repair di-iron protein [Flavobacterium oreochromis]
MNTIEHKLVGDYVAEDYRTAQIFSKFGIDFCCKGNRTIKEVCNTVGIQEDILIKELNSLDRNLTIDSNNFKAMSLDTLIDYIEEKHHTYVEEKIPVIMQLLNKICQVHGTKNPDLFEIRDLFVASSNDLSQHMKKEELILFPFIKKMVSAANNDIKITTPSFMTVNNPIQMMKHEHENEGDRFDKISKLTNRYTPPQGACNTYKVTYAMLNEFEEDLHKHIHLENNILFPSAMQLEEKLIY